jgi:hypothetical protein
VSWSKIPKPEREPNSNRQTLAISNRINTPGKTPGKKNKETQKPGAEKKSTYRTLHDQHPLFSRDQKHKTKQTASPRLEATP